MKGTKRQNENLFTTRNLSKTQNKLLFIVYDFDSIFWISFNQILNKFYKLNSTDNSDKILIKSTFYQNENFEWRRSCLKVLLNKLSPQKLSENEIVHSIS